MFLRMKAIPSAVLCVLAALPQSARPSNQVMTVVVQLCILQIKTVLLFAQLPVACILEIEFFYIQHLVSQWSSPQCREWERNTGWNWTFCLLYDAWWNVLGRAELPVLTLCLLCTGSSKEKPDWIFWYRHIIDPLQNPTMGHEQKVTLTKAAVELSDCCQPSGALCLQHTAIYSKHGTAYWNALIWAIQNGWLARWLAVECSTWIHQCLFF